MLVQNEPVVQVTKSRIMYSTSYYSKKSKTSVRRFVILLSESTATLRPLKMLHVMYVCTSEACRNAGSGPLYFCLSKTFAFLGWGQRLFAGLLLALKL
jgi:hypothetical protein